MACEYCDFTAKPEKLFNGKTEQNVGYNCALSNHGFPHMFLTLWRRGMVTIIQKDIKYCPMCGEKL